MTGGGPGLPRHDPAESITEAASTPDVANGQCEDTQLLLAAEKTKFQFISRIYHTRKLNMWTTADKKLNMWTTLDKLNMWTTLDNYNFYPKLDCQLATGGDCKTFIHNHMDTETSFSWRHFQVNFITSDIMVSS